MFIIAVTGPSGAGKSAVAQQLAKRLDNCVNIDSDHVKHFVVTGFVYGDEPEGVHQWRLLGKNIGMIASNFAQEKYNIIINGYINEPAWEEIYQYIEFTHKFLLLPGKETVIERDKQRDKEFAMGKPAVAVHHDYFSSSSFYSDFVTIDSTEDSIGQTVEQIAQRVGV